MQTKSLEMHTGSFSAAGASCEVMFSKCCMQGVGLEVGAMKRQSIRAMSQLKSGNLVNNSWDGTLDFNKRDVLPNPFQRLLPWRLFHSIFFSLSLFLGWQMFSQSVMAADSKEFTYGSPGFSPDSERLIYDRCSSTGMCGIHVLDIKTNTLTYFQPPEGQLWFSGKFSPSGQQIVFVAVPLHVNEPLLSGNRDYGNAQIAIMDSDGHNVRMLTNRPGYKMAPNFSWSGKKIAFIQGDLRQPGSKTLVTKNDAYEIDIKNKGVRQLTDSKFFQMGRPSYLPNDLALVVDADAPSRVAGISNVEALWKYRDEMEKKYNHSRVYRFDITLEKPSAPSLMFSKMIGASLPAVDAKGQVYFLAQPKKTEEISVYRSSFSEEFTSWGRMKHLQTRATAVSPDGRFWVEVSKPSLEDDLNGIFMLDLAKGTWRQLPVGGRAHLTNP